MNNDDSSKHLSLAGIRMLYNTVTILTMIDHAIVICKPREFIGTPGELFLLVQNDGEGLLKVNFRISDIKVTFPEMQLPKHHAKKINISENVEGSPSIILNAGNGSCIIDMGYLEPKGEYKPFFVYDSHLSPIYGAYLLFLIVLIAGGAWACCRLLKSERHVDGVPYQELEMGQSDCHSANNVEKAEGWDESWDDEWDEIKEEKPPNGHQTANALPNGITSRNSDTDGRQKGWDD
ncbi:unnamed protein product [Dovyalis caffra]|uniref:DUF7356 domain-containing protein n=1 Tax=Dovyalis caffra TaxID=77055 RepID=A0AAV1RXC3_9ROSI|nr:unnamed protein product [Dovyalis caffra]